MSRLSFFSFKARNVGLFSDIYKTSLLDLLHTRNICRRYLKRKESFVSVYTFRAQQLISTIGISILDIDFSKKSLFAQ